MTVVGLRREKSGTSILSVGVGVYNKKKNSDQRDTYTKVISLGWISEGRHHQSCSTGPKERIHPKT